MTKDEAHAAQRRNFHRTLKSACESVQWMAKWQGGDGRLEEAMELWYAANPDKDIREELEKEPDTCPDPNCGPCYDPEYYPF